MSTHHEIIIIGGGPAGAAAALYLRGFGFDVLVAEKKSFPRETLCGEFLSQEVVHSLEELNLSGCFLKLEPNAIDIFRVADDTGRELSASLGFKGYGIKRGAFDNLLLSSAADKGAEVLQPAEIISITKSSNKYTLLAKTPGGDEYILTARLVIAAYGKQNPLDKKLGRSFTRYLSGLNGIKFHVPSDEINFKKNEIRIYTSDNIYCGVNAVNDETTTLCFLENRDRLKHPPRRQLQILAQKNPGFNALFNNPADIEKYPVYGTGNIYFGRKEKSVEGIIMIGDAAGVIAPLAGDGIGMALQSAKIIAEIIARNPGSGNIAELYNKEWNRVFSSRLRSAKIYQDILLKGYIRKPALSLAGLFPSLLNGVIKSTRGKIP